MGHIEMGHIKTHRPVLLVLGAISGRQEAIDWARARAVDEWGPIALSSNTFDFDFTTFYEAEMGTSLKKKFFVFDRLIEPARLVQIKRLTNEWEELYRQENDHPESRPLNLDPGYLTEAKLVLATTKDRDHRLYLDDGIYAEVTLYFYQAGWQGRPWTYPDYQSSGYHEFFTRCRNYLRKRYREPTSID